MNAPDPDECQHWLDQANEARSIAYAPYSQFTVGAVAIFRDRDGESIEHAVGVNVENASYGLTVCAERVAVFTAVVRGMRPGALVGMALVAESPQPITPCGACRQVLAEFGGRETWVRTRTLPRGDERTYTLDELLPYAFRLAP